MQSSFSRAHTSLTKTRQTRNHIHISDAAVIIQNQVQKFSPSFLAFFSSSHFYSTVNVAYSWKWSTLLLGAFPTFRCTSQRNFLRDPFFIRIDQETEKSQGTTKLLQKHSEKGRQDHWMSTWAPVPWCEELKQLLVPLFLTVLRLEMKVWITVPQCCAETHICSIITTQVHSKMHCICWKHISQNL